MVRVQSGADRVLASPPASLRGKRLGLVANPSSIDSSFASVPTRMAQHPDLTLVALYGPEHGVRGEAQAGDHVSGDEDRATGLPVYSLYGETQVPTAEMLAPIDVLVVDMQDIGVRYTTYISTVANVIDACAGHGVDVVILDRPNPLGGSVVAGNVLDAAFTSFVGCHPIPALHGLTIGEFGRLYARDKGLSEPSVLAMDGWSRELWYDGTGLPWVLPSPNLPTLDSVAAFPATCLFEGTNLSEGRGTTRPFEFVGAPYVDPDALARYLDDLGLPGVRFRPVWFQPTFSKHAGTTCAGVQVYITDRHACDSVELGVRMVEAVRRLYPDDFGWRESANGRYFFDLLAGTDQLRKAIDASASLDEMLAGWRQQAAEFSQHRSDILLYD